MAQVKSTCCFCRGSGLGSQNPSTTPVPGIQCPLRQVPRIHVVHIHTHRQNIRAHKMNKSKKIKIQTTAISWYARPYTASGLCCICFMTTETWFIHFLCFLLWSPWSQVLFPPWHSMIAEVSFIVGLWFWTPLWSQLFITSLCYPSICQGWLKEHTKNLFDHGSEPVSLPS